MVRHNTQSSRLSRTSEKQNRKQTIYFTIGTIIVIVSLIQFGPILVNFFGNLVYSIRGSSEETNQISGKVLLNPPVLREIPKASKETQITFKGTSSESRGTVEIYVNDELVDEIKIVDDLNFEVKDVLLSTGQNTIKARFVRKNQSSSFSDEIIVSYLKEKPKLEVSFPSDNATFTKADKNILIKGITDPENTVSINGFRAIVESDGEFSYQYTLNDGENTLKLEAVNPAGNNTELTLKVTYNP